MAERGRGLTAGALLGAAALAGFHGVQAVAAVCAQRAWLPEWLGAWLATLLLALGAAWLFARAAR